MERHTLMRPSWKGAWVPVVVLLVLGGGLAACGGAPPKPADLETLDGLRASRIVEAIRQDPAEIENANVRELRELALEALRASDRYHEESVANWRRNRQDAAQVTARMGLTYHRAAENYFRAAEARERLAAANVSLQGQIQRRNEYMERLQSEQELIAMLETIRVLFQRNEELQRQLATIQEQARVESRALYAIQEARIEQRAAEGMRAEQFATSTYRDAQQLLTRAQARFEDSRFEEAYEIAVQALDVFRRAGEEARPRFMSEQDRLLSDATNRRLYERAQQIFGADRARIDARGLVIVMPDLFDARAAEVRDTRRGELEQVLDMLRQAERSSVMIEGHTDDRPNAEAAMALSQTRADTVLNFFLQRGIAARRLSTSGFGRNQPLYDNRSAQGRANNNRVEIIFLFR